jgi:hypothetical protein
MLCKIVPIVATYQEKWLLTKVKTTSSKVAPIVTTYQEKWLLRKLKSCQASVVYNLPPQNKKGEPITNIVIPCVNTSITYVTLKF